MKQVFSHLEALMQLDSTTGFFHLTDDYLVSQAERMGFAVKRLNKGGVQVSLGGAGSPLVIAAHADAIGLMVRDICDNGTLTVVPIGGLHPFYAVDSNVRVHARGGRVLSGTVRRTNPCSHLMSDQERDALPSYETNLAVFLDETVHSRAEAEALGICCGDEVAVEPRYRTTESGFIKSRFLDDKASCACLLKLMEDVSAGLVPLGRKVTLLFTEYEEIGHGGACGIPEDTRDFLAVDIGCVGPGHASSEQKVSICVKDAAFPYHTDFVTEMVDLCRGNEIPYALDMFIPHYGSDANVALRAGHDVRHGLIGPGVLETHGYERTHRDALDATCRLLTALVRA